MALEANDNVGGMNEEITALKNQVFTLLVALVVVSGTLTVFLYRQTTVAGKDLAQAQLLESAINSREVAMNNFLGQLVAYGEKHPEFKPLLINYGMGPALGTPQSAAPKK
jgi:hypothetical protein